MATLLPSACFGGDGRDAPARALIDAGVAVALGSNFNPHHTQTLNMQAVVALACGRLGMTIEEAISAATINGAYALGCADKVGSLEPGKSADLLILNAGHYRDLEHSLGTNLVHLTMKRGKFIYKEGEVAPLAADDSCRTRAAAANKKAGRPDRRPASLTLLGPRYLTNTEMVPLTVWPPGPYAVKVYTELVIGVTVKLPLAGRVCDPNLAADQHHRSGVLRRPGEDYRVACRRRGHRVGGERRDPHRAYVDRRVGLYLARRVGRRQGVGGGQRSG